MGIVTSELEIIIKDIRDGVYDDQLENLTDAISRRKDYQNALKFFSFNVGDRVRYVSSVSPKYLAYKPGTIVEINRKRVVVKLDNPVGRFAGKITTPPNLIERI